MEDRHLRNLPALTPEEQAALGRSRVFLAGCGGLGGYLAEYLARAGVGQITAVDGDVFRPSNLNRQLLCTVDRLDYPKALAVKERIAAVDPAVECTAVTEFLTRDSAPALIRGHALVLDALDSVPARLMLEDACAQAGIPMVHGAVQGWLAQAATVLPGSGALHRLYARAPQQEDPPSCLSCTCALCAAIQAAEAVKLLCGRAPDLAGKLFFLDLETMESHSVSI